MNTVEVTAGTPWGVGAMATAKWGGINLKDFLKNLGTFLHPLK